MQRHGRIYPGKAHWTQKHMDWLAREKFEEPATEATRRLLPAMRWRSRGAELEAVGGWQFWEQAPKHQTIVLVIEFG